MLTIRCVSTSGEARQNQHGPVLTGPEHGEVDGHGHGEDDGAGDDDGDGGGE